MGALTGTPSFPALGEWAEDHEPQPSVSLFPTSCSRLKKDRRQPSILRINCASVRTSIPQAGGPGLNDSSNSSRGCPRSLALGDRG
jgi:hypothetical protein